MKFATTLLTFCLLLIANTAYSQLFEDFESGSKGAYANDDVDLSTGNWQFNDALLGSQDGDKTNGSQSARIRDGYIQMNFDKSDGADLVSFYAANSGFSGDTGGQVQVSYSTDGGSNWEELGDEITLDDDLTQYTLEAGIPGEIRFEFRKTDGNRINIDDVEVTDFAEAEDEPTIEVSADGSSIGNNYLYNFSGITLGNSSSATFTIRNQGNETLEINSVELEDYTAFSLSGPDDSELEFGESTEFDVTFEPDAVEDYESNITISSNADNFSEFNIDLAGSGLEEGAPIPISEAREASHGTEVTVTGWVTVADEFGGPLYLQDETGGIPVYDSATMSGDFDLDVSPGDSIVVTGPRGDFNGLEQITDNGGDVTFSIYPESNQIIAPETITVQQFNTDEYQGELVLIENLSFDDSGTFSGEENYDFSDETGSGVLRIDGDTDIPGSSIPDEPTTITGIAAHYQGTPQFQPRTPRDLGTDIVASRPFVTHATATSATFSWETLSDGTSEIVYGTAPNNYDLGEVSSDELTTDHELTIDGLEPATIYHASLRSEVDGQVSNTGNIVFSTMSSDEATREINVYFNGDVDHDLAIREEATGDFDFPAHYIDRIEQAEESIDITFYNLSQDVGSDVTDALIHAYRNNNVDVRVIMDADLSNPAEQNKQDLENMGIPVIQSDAGGRTEGIMHNKIAIIDYHGGDPEDVWLITSSWNSTDSGTFNQYQNMIEFQDPAIAGGYTTEFEQMWGGSGSHPNESDARFGTNKSIVNPTAFWIDDVYLELYFSPQTNVENRIIESFEDARHDINVNTMGITRWRYRNALEGRHDAGINIRGVIGDRNIGGPSSDILDELIEFGDFHDHGESGTRLLHHKAAIIDGQDESYGTGHVITGSMNWSASGNFNNDENTLFIYDDDITNLYMQEFAARYAEAGGQDELVITSTDDDPIAEQPETLELDQNYPNPFNPVTTISFSLPQSDEVTLTVYDVLGREVSTLVDGEELQSGTHEVNFDGSNISSGVYLYRIQLSSGQQLSRRMTLVK